MLSCYTKVQVKVMNAPSANAAQVNGTKVIGANVTFTAESITGDWVMIKAGEYVNIYKQGVLAVVVSPIAPPPPPPPPVAVLTPFTLGVTGYKTFSGNLEKL